MTRRLLSACTLAVAFFALSCSDGALRAPTAPDAATTMDSRESRSPRCLGPEQIERLAKRAFGPRRGIAEAIEEKAEKIIRLMARRDTVGAKKAAFDAVKFVLLQQGKPRFDGNSEDVEAIIRALFCLAGVATTETSTSALVYPTDLPQVIVTGDGRAGVSLPGNPVTEPTLITITPIPGSFAPGSGPLHTKLDQYPGYYEFKKQSATDPPLPHPVVVAVCPSGAMTPEVRARLRLGHDASAGFEVTPAADASFLTCPALTAMNSSMPKWMRTLASLVLPRTLNASAVRFGTGGVGGSAGEFSPFGPVDPVLSANGGVGGSAGEFLVAPTGAGNPLAPPSAGVGSGASRKAVSQATMLQQLSAQALPGARFRSVTLDGRFSHSDAKVMGDRLALPVEAASPDLLDTQVR